MKQKTTAWLLALFLWWIWAHKFYLGKNGRWVLYLFFCWTWIPVILGIIEAVQLYQMKPKVFNIKYNEGDNVKQESLLSDKDKQQLSTPLLRWLVIVWGWFILLMILWFSWVLDYTEEELAQMEIEKVEQQKVADEKAEQLAIEQLEQQKQEIIEIKERLTKEIEGIGAYDTNNIKGDSISLGITLWLLGALVDIATEHENHVDTEIVDLSKQLQSKISTLQGKLYPIMRKKYGEYINKAFWHADAYIDVTTKWWYSDTIIFVWWAFTSSKNIKQIHNDVWEILIKLRFTTAEYRWIPNGAWAVYTMDTLNDNEIIKPVQ